MLSAGEVVASGNPKDILSDEANLVKYELDIPFALKVAKGLEKLNIRTSMYFTRGGINYRIMSITFKEVEHIYSENTPFAYHALKGVNLKITDQSFTAIIGQTGSGKSTLIQHINALLLPTSGSINIDEYLITATDKPSKLKPLRKKAGLVFQFPEYQLFEETIEKDIIFGPMNFGVSEEEAKKIAHNVLKTVGLDESSFK